MRVAQKKKCLSDIRLPWKRASTHWNSENDSSSRCSFVRRLVLLLLRCSVWLKLSGCGYISYTVNDPVRVHVTPAQIGARCDAKCIHPLPRGNIHRFQLLPAFVIGNELGRFWVWTNEEIAFQRIIALMGLSRELVIKSYRATQSSLLTHTTQ